MSIRTAALALVAAILVAGALALFMRREPDATASTAAPRGTSADLSEDLGSPSEAPEALPPNHPPIGGAGSLRGGVSAGSAEDSDAPAISWKMPSGWQEAPSPNAMRLATYQAPGGVEVSVSRAGGAPEANIQRWMGQFDDVGRDGRVEKTVRGIHVITVDVTGTYTASGMTMGAAAPESSTSAKRNWSLVGAIIESRSPSYFFKMTGPAAAIRAARPAFDHLVDSITPA